MSDAPPARILIVDDSAEVRRQIEATLRERLHGLEVLTAADGMTGFKALVSTAVDLVLCDWVMPGIDGLKFLELKKSRPELAQIPVLMLTAVGDVDAKVAGFERGAGDFITKPCDPRELAARVSSHLALKQARDELTAKNALLEKLSSTDDLTGLYNRRHFFVALERELERAQRHQHALTLIALDLDRFKLVNDTYGHAEGDRVLKATADCILHHVRRYDVVARVGGEELALILPETDLEPARVLAERIRKTFELEILAGGRKAVTLSGGIAQWNAAESAGQLLKRADDALYEAKAKGRNRIEQG